MRGLLLALAFVAACSRGPVRAPPGTGGEGGSPPAGETICDNGLDDDGNGLADCADPACASASNCPACGDGFLDVREACEGIDLAGETCFSQGFNGGGILHCTADCRFDPGDCRRHEDCLTPGDEDRNGVADCADLACAAAESCWSLTPVDPPFWVRASSQAVLVFRAADGMGRPVVGQAVELSQAPPTVSFSPEPVRTDENGEVRFSIREGPLPGLQEFVASMLDAPVTAWLELQSMNPAPGTILSALDADRIAGADDSGPAAGAHVGAPVQVQVGANGTIYVAEACRVLLIAPDGMLYRLMGTGVCGTSPAEGDPLDADVTVSGIALDPNTSALYVADAAAGLVRVLRAGNMRAVAGGGDRVGALADGGPATAAHLRPSSVAVAPNGQLVLRDEESGTFRSVGMDTGLIDTVFPWEHGCSEGGTDGCSERCQVSWDRAGTAFVSGTFCTSVNGDHLSVAPGVARYDAGQRRFIHLGGVSPGLGPSGVPAELAQLPAITAQAFDVGGNLFLLAGDALYKIDGVTGFVEKLAGDQPGFAGDGSQLGGARFRAPSGLAFGPNGDLYVADSGNGVLRRIAGLGANWVTWAEASVVSGDAQSVFLAQPATDELVFRITDEAGRPLAGIQPLVLAGDPSLIVQPANRTDASGVSRFAVRMGLVPMTSQVWVYLAGIHQEPTGSNPAVFTVIGQEPPPGTVFVAAGEGNRVLQPGQSRSGPDVNLGVSRVQSAPDGMLYMISRSEVVRLDTAGLLSTVADNVAPLDLAVDYQRGWLLVANATMVRTINLQDRTMGVLAGPGAGADGDGDGGSAVDATFAAISSIAIEYDGSLDVGSLGRTGVRRIDPRGIVSRSVQMSSCGPGDDQGLVGDVQYVAAAGSTLWIVGRGCQDSQASLFRRDADGTLQHFPTLLPWSVLPWPDGTVLLGDDRGMQRFDPTTKETTHLSGVPGYVTGMTRDRDGHLWFAAGGKLVAIW